MIIRSQDKRSITDDLNLEIHHESWDFKEWGIGNNAIGVMGTYSTEEKAIKVLDMICNFYAEHLEELKCDEPPFVRAFFTMPQDSEV